MMQALKLTDEDYGDAINYAMREPLWFINEVFGAEPWAKQIEILESVRDNPITMVKSCHAIGKSWIAAHVVLWFLYAHPNSVVFTTAPTARQVVEILWREIRAAHANARVPLGGDAPLTAQINIAEKWYAFGYTSAKDNPTAGQGIHADYVLGVVDEACGIEDPTWDAIKANLSAGKTRLLGIGNPTDPATKFAKYFDREDISKISVSAFDTPNFVQLGITLDDYRTGAWKLKAANQDLPFPFLISPEYVGELYLDGEKSPAFKARVLAEFPVSNEDALLSPEWIKAAQARWRSDYRWEPGTPRALGVDVARQGNDKSVAIIREGMYAKVARTWQGVEGVELGAHLVSIARTFDATHGAVPIAIDAIGVGASPFDQVRASGHPCVELIGSESSKEPDRFENARAEWFWSLRQAFRDGLIAIPPWEKSLAEELEAIRYLFNKKGNILIEDKARIKARLKRSPDYADALCYAWAAEWDSSLTKFMAAGGMRGMVA